MRQGYLLLFWVLLTGFRPPDTSDPDARYYACTWQEFYQLAPVRQLIDPAHPDYPLLDAAIFHATNEARQRAGLPPFRYARGLHQAARQHSTAMIEQDFYDHYNPKELRWHLPSGRIAAFDRTIQDSGENIAQFCLIDTKPVYCLYKKPGGTYVYYDCDTEQPYQVYTFLAYARHVVQGWMDSPTHRQNILNERFQLLGCAARFSPNPFGQRQLPFARLTQDFGTRPGAPTHSVTAQRR